MNKQTRVKFLCIAWLFDDIYTCIFIYIFINKVYCHIPILKIAKSQKVTLCYRNTHQQLMCLDWQENKSVNNKTKRVKWLWIMWILHVPSTLKKLICKWYKPGKDGEEDWNSGKNFNRLFINMSWNYSDIQWQNVCDINYIKID